MIDDFTVKFSNNNLNTTFLNNIRVPVLILAQVFKSPVMLIYRPVTQGHD